MGRPRKREAPRGQTALSTGSSRRRKRLGARPGPEGQRRSPLTRALESAAAQLAQEWADRIGVVVKGLMEHSGRRLAVAEAAVDRMIHFCEDAIQRLIQAIT